MISVSVRSRYAPRIRRFRLAGRGWACSRRQAPLPGSACPPVPPLPAPASLCEQNEMLTFWHNDTLLPR